MANLLARKRLARLGRSARAPRTDLAHLSGEESVDARSGDRDLAACNRVSERIAEELSQSVPAAGRLVVAKQRRIPKPINRKRRC
jgi:hypothetical protein